MSNKIPGERVSSRPPNIVTMVLDCARAKNFATSGGDLLAETPVIDALAAQGTEFPRAVASANWTVPSHFSIFTGFYPNVHGVRTFQKLTVPLETDGLGPPRARLRDRHVLREHSPPRRIRTGTRV